MSLFSLTRRAVLLFSFVLSYVPLAHSDCSPIATLSDSPEKIFSSVFTGHPNYLAYQVGNSLSLIRVSPSEEFETVRTISVPNGATAKVAFLGNSMFVSFVKPRLSSSHDMTAPPELQKVSVYNLETGQLEPERSFIDSSGDGQAEEDGIPLENNNLNFSSSYPYRRSVTDEYPFEDWQFQYCYENSISSQMGRLVAANGSRILTAQSPEFSGMFCDPLYCREPNQSDIHTYNNIPAMYGNGSGYPFFPDSCGERARLGPNGFFVYNQCSDVPDESICLPIGSGRYECTSVPLIADPQDPTGPLVEQCTQMFEADTFEPAEVRATYSAMNYGGRILAPTGSPSTWKFSSAGLPDFLANRRDIRIHEILGAYGDPLSSRFFVTTDLSLLGSQLDHIGGIFALSSSGAASGFLTLGLRNARLGDSFSPLGRDVNGDYLFAIGAPGEGEIVEELAGLFESLVNQGEFFRPEAGTVIIVNQNLEFRGALFGEFGPSPTIRADAFGTSVAPVGDIDGDARPDLAIGAYGGSFVSFARVSFGEVPIGELTSGEGWTGFGKTLASVRVSGLNGTEPSHLVIGDETKIQLYRISECASAFPGNSYDPSLDGPGLELPVGDLQALFQLVINEINQLTQRTGGMRWNSVPDVVTPFNLTFEEFLSELAPDAAPNDGQEQRALEQRENDFPQSVLQSLRARLPQFRRFQTQITSLSDQFFTARSQYLEEYEQEDPPSSPRAIQLKRGLNRIKKKLTRRRPRLGKLRKLRVQLLHSLRP
ncbi:MAG: FG-GAP repeat protein [Bdellovibrionales bacterium]|nr:FG-GAP repeat protein [Bdellovibrionales bacterium]